MDKGAWVRHRSQAEWGAGQVSSNNGTHLQIEFENGKHFKIGVVAATQHLQPSEPGTLKPKPSRKGAPAVPCEHCKKSLGTSVYNPTKSLKSCPSCSTRNGRQHVFYNHPDGFGVSEAGAAKKDARGVQSHCKACRFDESIPGRGQCDAVLI